LNHGVSPKARYSTATKEVITTVVYIDHCCGVIKSRKAYLGRVQTSISQNKTMLTLNSILVNFIILNANASKNNGGGYV